MSEKSTSHRTAREKIYEGTRGFGQLEALLIQSPLMSLSKIYEFPLVNFVFPGTSRLDSSLLGYCFLEVGDVMSMTHQRKQK